MRTPHPMGESRMTIAKKTRTINAPKDKVWAVLEDFGEVHRINPFVKKTTSECIPGTMSVGDTRRCVFYNGKSYVDEKVIELDEGKSVTIQITGGTMPFKAATATFTLKHISDSQSQLSMKMNYTAKGGSLAPVVGLAMKPMMNMMLGKVLKSLDRHLITGHEIGKNGKLV